MMTGRFSKGAVVGFLLAAACTTAPAKKPDGHDARAVMARLLAEQNFPLVSVVQGGTLKRLPAPPLEPVELHRVEQFQPTRPVVLVLAYLPERSGAAATPARAWVLTGQPDAWGEVVKAAGVRVADASAATALARLYHDATRPTGKRHDLVESADKLPFRPNLDPADAQKRDAALVELRARIAPPVATVVGDGFVVAAWVLEGAKLVQRSFTVDRGGAITSTAATVRDDLPLVY